MEEALRERYVKVAKAAERLMICEVVARRSLRSGKLRSALLNRCAGYRIPAAEVDRALRGERTEVRVA